MTLTSDAEIADFEGSARGRRGLRPRPDDRAVSPALPVPLTGERAQELADEWVAAWNAHDLDAIMALYAPGIVFQTPTIIDTLGVADGRVRRRRAHSGSTSPAASSGCPTCASISTASTPGCSSLAMTYRWADGTPVCELHEYNEQGLIERVQALYRGLSW